MKTFLIYSLVALLSSCLPGSPTSNKKKYDEPNNSVSVNPQETPTNTVTPYTAKFESSLAELKEGEFTYINVELDKPANRTITVNLKRMYFSSATDTVDYVMPIQTVTFNNNETKKSLFVQALADQVIDNFEAVYFQLEAVSDGVDVNPSYFTVLIENVSAPTTPPANTPPKIQFSAPSMTVNEGNNTVNFQIRADKTSTSAITFNVSANSSNATAGSDYNLVQTSFVVPAGQTAVNVPIQILDDNIVEGAESIQLMIQNVSGAELGTFSVGTLTINDNDMPITPNARLDKANQTVSESVGNILLNVLLDRTSSMNQTFTLTPSGNNGLDNLDYSFPNGNQVTIPAGGTSGTLTIQINNDNIVENDEILILTLSGGNNVQIMTPSAFILTIQNDDNNTPTPTPTPTPPTSSVTAFQNTLYNNVLRNAGTGRCLNCHRPNGSLISISPYHSHDDPAQAHTTIMSLGLVNLNNPSASRLVAKVAGGHNAWSGDAAADALVIQQQIQAWADMLQSMPNPMPTPNPASNLKTNQLTFSDGVSVAGNRYNAQVIAMWDFKEGQGNTIRDKSNMNPPMDLTITGDIKWLGGQGIKCDAPANGNHWARNNNPEKMYLAITSSGQFSVEAWVIAENDDQEGPSRIMSLSNGTGNRNFTMGQEGPYLNYRVRTRGNGGNGSNPAYEPQVVVFKDRPAVNHVVMTFNGRERKIFVNGSEITDGERDKLYDGAIKGIIGNDDNAENWQRNYDFILCNETSGNRVWKGDIFFAAVHRRALTQSQILQNFNAGFTEKTVLVFDISQYTNSGATAEVTIEAIDGQTYTLSDLTFKGLSSPTQVKGINVLINDTKAISGQTWAIVDRMVQNNQDLMLSAPVIAADQGAMSDRFSLSFDQLGNQANVISAPVMFPYENSSIPFSPGELANQIGTKDFMEINQTLSNLTGVPKNNNQVSMIFEDVKQGLPIGDSIDAYSSTHQINVTKITYEYCSQMVANTTLRNNFFGTNINTSGQASNVFNTTTRNQVVSAVAGKLNTSVSYTPTQAEVNTEVQGLISDMIGQGKTVRDILVGTCMLATSSSTTLLK